jgi:hypothetical protein
MPVNVDAIGCDILSATGRNSCEGREARDFYMCGGPCSSASDRRSSTPELPIG